MDNLKWGLFALNVPRQVSEDSLLAKVRQVRPQVVATVPQVSRQLQVRSSPPGCGRRRSEGGCCRGGRCPPAKALDGRDHTSQGSPTQRDARTIAPESQDTQPNPNRTKNPNTHWLLKDCWVNAFLWTRLPRTHPEIKARIMGRKSAAL